MFWNFLKPAMQYFLKVENELGYFHPKHLELICKFIAFLMGIVCTYFEILCLTQKRYLNNL